MERAREYRARAYAPYSRFAVGAALLMDDGAVVCGCNVENASYGMSICAERVAMSCAIASGRRTPLAVAVAGPDGVFCSPCGACRQFLSEFNPRMEVLLIDGGELKLFRLDELFPHNFHLDDFTGQECSDV
jgi:cytidine deaminase